MTFIRPLWILSLLVYLSACSSYQGMFYAEHTHVGAQIKISPQTDNKPLEVNIGYDRGLFAVVPRTEAGRDAGSVISKTDLDIVFTTNSVIKNVFATGRAAKNISKEGERVAALLGQCLEDVADLKTRKANALSKLDKIKANNDKLKGLYQKVFPTRTYFPLMTTQDEMYRALHAHIGAICYSEDDDHTLTLYESL